MPIESVKFVMLQPGPNDALSQNFMKLGLLVAEKRRGQTDRHTDRQDSCFIILYVMYLLADEYF